jgi:T-complex protein 1 subunit beta
MTLAVISSMMGEKRKVLGAGWSEVLMARARLTAGKIALAMDAFARALRQIPMILATNAGLDAPEIVANIRAAPVAGKKTFGLGLEKRGIGLTECLMVKRVIVIRASEAAEQILRVDEIVKCPPIRQKGGR